MTEEYTDEQIQEWDKEDFGNLPDGFFLSQSEINELRKSKRELTDYARKKLKELMNNQEPYPDEMFEVAAQREALQDYKEAFAYLNNTEENKFIKILPQKTKDAYNLIAEYCMKEYKETYGEIPEEEYMRFLVGDFYGTGNGRTLCVLCSQSMPYGDDYDKTAPHPQNYEPVNSKEYRAVREFHQLFGSWMLQGVRFVSREDFFEKYGHLLPSALVELKDKSCYLNYNSKLHFNFS